MDCDTLRALILVYGDDKRPDSGVIGHLADCAACRSWDAANVTLDTLIAAEDPAPSPRLDVSGADLARRARPRRGPTRAALAAVGVTHIAVALWALAHGLDGAAHGSHELVSLDVALGVGFMTAAYRPWRALALLPLMGVAASLLWLSATLDIAAGETEWGHEWPHLVTVVGVLLLAIAVRRPSLDEPRTGRFVRAGARRPHLRVVKAVAWLRPLPQLLFLTGIVAGPLVAPPLGAAQAAPSNSSGPDLAR